jgi:hypothetical protein
MAPWDEPSSITCYDSKMEFLQMEKEKVVNKDAKKMMNRIKELFLALDNEQVLEEETNEESDQEDLDEFSHDEDPDDAFEEDEALASALQPNDDVHATTPPAHENKEMVIFFYCLVKEPLHKVDKHIHTFIQIGRRRWDFGHLIFYRDPIYDIEGTPQEKGFELSSSEDYFSYVYGSYVSYPDDDIIKYLF